LLWDTVWAIRDGIYSILLQTQKTEFFQKRFEQAKENCFYWKVSSSEEAKKSDDYKYYMEHLRLDPSKTALCLAALKWMAWDLEGLKKELVAQFGEAIYTQLALLMDAALMREQVREAQNFEFYKAMNLRDSFQARVMIQFQSLQKNLKSLALLHNVHVGKAMSAMRSDVVTPSDRFPGQAFISAGEVLKGSLGQKYYSIGVGGYKLSSIRDGDYPIPSEPDSLDGLLHERCESFCLADVTHLRKPLWMHNETAKKGMYGIPSEQFDAYYYIRESHAGTRLE
jgi:hypothetical protein